MINWKEWKRNVYSLFTLLIVFEFNIASDYILTGCDSVQSPMEGIWSNGRHMGTDREPTELSRCCGSL